MSIKVLVQGSGAYVDVFNDILGVTAVSTAKMDDIALLEFIDECDVVCLTGGSDINPVLYHQTKNKRTTINPSRDKNDIMVVERALSKGKRLVGICRGAQLLCVTAGGTLVQDITGHRFAMQYSKGLGHNITTINGDSLEVSSTHHQMMHLTGSNHKLLAWAEGLSKHYLLGENNTSAYVNNMVDSQGAVKEPEAVWFPDLLGLAVQFHPERMPKSSKGRKYFEELLWQYVL